MTTEIWKDVKGYEGLYQVSNLGRVKSLYYGKERIMHPQKRQHGYLGVQLHGRGGHAERNFRTMSVHRLVAEAFIPNPDGLTEVNHKDEDKTNNIVDNLEWISHKANTNYGTAQKRRAAQIINNPKYCTPINQYTLDGELVAEYPSIAEAFRQTGCSRGNIHKALVGTYTHAYGYKWRYAD